MSESQRQAYMEAMGVDIYYPRLQLVGALATRQCELAEPVSAEPVNAAPVEAASLASRLVAEIQPAVSAVDEVISNAGSVQAAPHSGGGSAAAMRALMGESAEAETCANEPADITDASSRGQRPEPAPVFSLVISRVGPLLIVDEAPATDAEYSALLHNLAFALGAGKCAVQQEVFSWPMLNSAHVDQGAAVAIATLEKVVAMQLSKPVGDLARYVLLLGDPSSQYLTLEDNPGLVVLKAGSAHACLVQPPLKAALWRQLQPLRKSLVSK